MRTLSTIAAAFLLAAAGFGASSCSRGDNDEAERSPGLNEKPVQPTTGDVGSQRPTPTVRTDTSG